MTTHQRAAMAQTNLVNFFGESGTVASILNRVQPSHTQPSNEISEEQDLNISQQDSYSSSDTRRVRRHRTHNHHNERKHSRKDDRK